MLPADCEPAGAKDCGPMRCPCLGHEQAEKRGWALRADGVGDQSAHPSHHHRLGRAPKTRSSHVIIQDFPGVRWALGFLRKRLLHLLPLARHPLLPSMADVEMLRGMLGVHPDFPKKVGRSRSATSEVKRS